MERTAARIVRAAIARDARRREAEKRQLKTIEKLLDRVADRPDPKITALVEDLERDVLPVPGEKAIIFTEYRDTLGALRQAFAAHPDLAGAFVELTGGLSAAQRKSRIARFHRPECRVLLATDAASEGLNLQEQCCRLYHFELPWNPNRLEQRNGRVDRHGQKRPPIVRYLFYPDSPEDRVLDRLVQRIARMHDDRVSTPDILGILEGSRIEEVLGRIESAESGEAEGESLMKVFEARQEEFAHQIAPLLLADAAVDSTLPWANAVSADPMIEDDPEFEHAMLDTLRSSAGAHTLTGMTADRVEASKAAVVLNSLCFDFALRLRMAGTHVSFTYILPMPVPASGCSQSLAHDRHAHSVAGRNRAHHRRSLALASSVGGQQSRSRRLWAGRRRLRPHPECLPGIRT